MQTKNILKIFLLLSSVLFFMSTKACQKNYKFADNTNVQPSSSPTSSDTVATATPSPSSSPTSTASSTATPTPTTTASSSVARRNLVLGNTALRSLEEVARRTRNILKTSAANAGTTKPSNWLGKAYSNDEIAGIGIDSDGDGYTDALEKDFGTDANNPDSFPLVRPVTLLASRLAASDPDVDGLNKEEELAHGTNPDSADSDEDGYSDGAEVISHSNPLDGTSIPKDSDGDGLSDEHEVILGSDPSNPDTDSDRLRDDLEIFINSDVNSNDTDGDGILDGQEVFMGSDPTISESK